MRCLWQNRTTSLQALQTEILQYPERKVTAATYTTSLSQKNKQPEESSSLIAQVIDQYPFAGVLGEITQALVEVSKRPDFFPLWPRSNFTSTCVATMDIASPLLICHIDHTLVPSGSRSRDFEKVAHAAMYESVLARRYRPQLLSSQAGSVRFDLSEAILASGRARWDGFVDIHAQSAKRGDPNRGGPNTSLLWKFPDGFRYKATLITETAINVRKATSLALQKKNFRLIQDIVTAVVTSPVARLTSLRHPQDSKSFVVPIEVRDALSGVVKVGLLL